MLDFLKTALATACGNILMFLLYQGFVKSKLGVNIQEEISRWFNQIFIYWRQLWKK